MSEWEEKLGSILADPQAMGQIMSLAQSLGAPSAPPQETSPAKAREENPPPDPAALFHSLTEKLDPRLMETLLRAIREYQADDDGRTVLLQALRPFVKKERYAKLDRAIELARMTRLIRIGLDAFRGGDRGDV